MPKLLLNLRHVPEDEADDVRAMLSARQIPFYETRPDRWGVSAGGIWIERDQDVDAAERLMAEYQQQRQSDARAQYDAARRAGTAGTMWSALRDNPWHALAVLLGIAAVVALLALPFLLL